MCKTYHNANTNIKKVNLRLGDKSIISKYYIIAIRYIIFINTKQTTAELNNDETNYKQINQLKVSSGLGWSFSKKFNDLSKFNLLILIFAP